ncbi:AAA family ATPase [Aeoliella sp.]|uniref:AAA family ATPase n=1 Tax=Aeoliella sp. TaxID=2795800 RepID=UPI003CCBB70D
MEAIILIGLQASGKSTFCRQRLFDTHVRINLDMLRTRHREMLLIAACHDAKQAYVVDNTNPTREDRVRTIQGAKAAGFRVVGYYFASKLEDCTTRNSQRSPQQVIPLKGLLGTYGRLQLPEWEEGFDELYYVSIGDTGEFVVSEWANEV